jgi:L-histidine N-alpha-methyltransferase
MSTSAVSRDLSRAIVSTIADDVRRGLEATPKTLPAYLFYDAEGSALYEQITDLPEYYLTRAEREIFETHSGDIVARVGAVAGRALRVIEMGAGSASKTEVLLRAAVAQQGRCAYVPIDVSSAAIHMARRRLRSVLPEVAVSPLIMKHEQALHVLHEASAASSLVLFIGSSVGNFEDQDAAALLGGLRDALGAGTWLLLGTDLRKSPEILLPAYDDSAGVTAAFNKNLLARINRELGGRFRLDRFRHVARWNDGASRIEMHLQSTLAQEIVIDELDLCVRFEAGETIHTESSIKYDLPRVQRLLGAGGFAIDTTFHDAARRFALHLARAS